MTLLFKAIVRGLFTNRQRAETVKHLHLFTCFFSFLYATSLFAQGNDLLVHLPFDDRQNPALDSSGNNRHAVINGASYIADAGDSSNSSLLFNGDSSVNIGTLDVNESELTLSAWIYTYSFPGSSRDSRIISKATGSSADDHLFMLSLIRKRGEDTTLRGRLRVNGKTKTLVARNSTLLKNTWHHTAMVYDGNKLKLYIDGQYVAGSKLRGRVDQDSTVDVTIGSQPGGGKHFDGLIDDVRIYSRALPKDELILLSDTRFAGESSAENSDVEGTNQTANAVQILKELNSSNSNLTTIVRNVKQNYSDPISGIATLSDSLAYPGAVGWAAQTTTGGRGGRVVIVNSLSNAVDPDDRITTFREALTEINEPRTIVFSVAGLIDYRSGPMVPESHIRLNNTDSSVTIACQSAPPPGVTLMGDGLIFSGNTNNVIMRHCRFRNSDPINEGSAGNSSCVRVMGTTPKENGEVQHDYILDHISCMWAADDPVAFGIPGLSQDVGRNMHNITISDSIVSEGDADSLHTKSGKIPRRHLHAMGISCASSHPSRTVERCSIVGNFQAHNGRRNGRLWGVNQGELINNIVYNPEEVALSIKARPTKINHVDGVVRGNLVQLGPTSKSNVKVIDLGGNNESNSRLKISGNFLGQHGKGTLVEYNNPPSSNSNSPMTVQVSTVRDIRRMSAQGSDHLRCIGASRPRRDSHDQRVINEFYQETGQVGIMGNHERDFREYKNVSAIQSWHDNDKDGMPDTWESKMELDNPLGYDLSDIYTNIEVFLNNLAACPSISFASPTVQFPAGTSTVSIPFNAQWETWADGQSFSVCLNGTCENYSDDNNDHAYTISGLSNGRYLLSITPIGSDGVAASISSSIEVQIGK